MKILVIQLATLDSIFQTVPLVLSLQRKMRIENPGCDIELLVADQFRGDFEFLLPEEIAIRYFAATEIIECITEQGDMAESLVRLKRWLGPLQSSCYDRIINLSTSAVSSYVSDVIAGDQCEVSGYTRAADGFFAILDDASAYHFAQCAAGGDNRAHIREVFSNVMQIAVEESALSGREVKYSRRIVINISAATKDREIESHKWTSLIHGILRKSSEKIVLIGRQADIELAERIILLTDSERVSSQVGVLDNRHTLALIDGSDLLVTVQGATVGLSNFSSTPSVCIFFQIDSVWERGPRVPGSRVILVDGPSEVPAEWILKECLSLINCDEGEAIDFETAGGVPYFKWSKENHDSFAWRLISAIYMKEEWPALEDRSQLQAFIRLHEINQLAYEQFETLVEGPDGVVSSQVLDRVDELFQTVCKLEPSVAPLIRWYRTEKIRIRPGSFDELFRDTKKVHDMINGVICHYLDSHNLLEDADMEVRCAN